MDRAHKAATRVELLMIARAYPWAEAKMIVDIGGGTGTFLQGSFTGSAPCEARYSTYHG